MYIVCHNAICLLFKVRLQISLNVLFSSQTQFSVAPPKSILTPKCPPRPHFVVLQSPVIIIILPKQTQVLPKFNIHINSSKTLVHESAKYLGKDQDCHLNFRQHINFLESKIARFVGILTKLEHVLPEKALISLYYALVNSHLLYGLTVWGGISKTFLDKLNTLQNKAVKIVTGARYFDHVTLHYNNLKILKLPDLYKFEFAKTMYSVCVTIFLFIFQICLSKDQIYFIFYIYLFSYIFILLSRASDQSAIRAHLGVASHLSTTPRWGNPAKCLSQRHHK